MSYYDLDDILSETRLIPCTFNVDAYGLGDLDLSRDTDQKDVRFLNSSSSSNVLNHYFTFLSCLAYYFNASTTPFI